MSMIDRQQGTKVRRTTRMKCFVCKRDDFVLNSLIYFEPVKRLENGGDMMEFSTNTVQILSQSEHMLLQLM